jgi:hypothetical protein
MTRLGVLFLFQVGLGLANYALSIPLVYTPNMLVHVVYVMSVMVGIYWLFFPLLPVGLIDVVLAPETGGNGWAEFAVVISGRVTASLVTSFFGDYGNVLTLAWFARLFPESVDTTSLAFVHWVSIVASLLMGFGVSANDPKYAWKCSAAHVFCGFALSFLPGAEHVPIRMGPVPGGIFLPTHQALSYVAYVAGILGGTSLSVMFVK